MNNPSKLEIFTTLIGVKSVFLYIILFTTTYMKAQNQIIPLWSGDIPNYIDAGEQEMVEREDIIKISKVQRPTLTVFLPSKANATGQGILIFPGGGYEILAYDWEGTDIAKWLNSRGIAAFVVKSRLPDEASSKVRHLSPFLDARRALQLVRFNAEKFNINSSKIGVMGFSAGGHLAATLCTQYDGTIPTIGDSIAQINPRPDFSILVYPVITMQSTCTHQGSRQALLGNQPEQSLVDQYSNELQVTADTPPAILIHSADDEPVPYQNSLLYYQALLKNNVPAALNLYPHGGHGYSLAIQDTYLNTWTEVVEEWLQSL